MRAVLMSPRQLMQCL